ncbi:MAG: GyrI-like domain-containing protein [Bacillota bacterium]
MNENNEYPVRLREIRETPVCSLRRIVTNLQQDLPPMINSLLEDITAMGGVYAGPPIVLYHDEVFKTEQADVEVAWPVLNKDLANKNLPALVAATLMHVGPYDGIASSYDAVYAWINQNGYRARAPRREIIYNDPQNIPQEQLTIEIVIPVEKALIT